MSTADDCLAFFEMLRNKGRYGTERILSRPSVELMTANHLTAGQRADDGIFLGDNGGWGFRDGLPAAAVVAATSGPRCTRRSTTEAPPVRPAKKKSRPGVDPAATRSTRR